MLVFIPVLNQRCTHPQEFVRNQEEIKFSLSLTILLQCLQVFGTLRDVGYDVTYDMCVLCLCMYVCVCVCVCK
mgnify:CR=1 FL=1